MKTEESLLKDSLQKMKYIRTNSLKRIFSLKRRSLEEQEEAKDNNNNKNNSVEILDSNLEISEPFQKPIWKCFSFEEICEATNGFTSGAFSFSLSYPFSPSLSLSLLSQPRNSFSHIIWGFREFGRERWLRRGLQRSSKQRRRNRRQKADKNGVG